jgi:tRNA nucleotidyltransferase (CCA-adding enzyme)
MDFVQEICKYGEVYIIGGAVRNYLYNNIHSTNIKIKDIDLVVRLIKQEQLINLLQKYGQVKLVGISFGVLKFKNNITNKEYDIALPRTEISIGPNYKDFKICSNENTTLEEDCKRRDATINSLAIRIYKQTDLDMKIINNNDIIDYVNGVNDLKNKIWKTVGDPLKRFEEDPTRIMRALRQSCELDLEIETNTKDAIFKYRDLLNIIKKQSPVRITDEFIKIINQPIKKSIKILEFILETKINEILEISKIGIDIFRNLLDNTSLQIKLAILLNTHNNLNIIKWCTNNELSATCYFDKDKVLSVICINQIYNDFCNIIQNYSKYKFRNFMIILENKFKTKSRLLIIDLIDYYNILNKTDIYNYYNENSNYPININEVKINGNVLINNYKMNGIQIKETKNKLLQMIISDEIENNTDILLKYISL